MNDAHMSTRFVHHEHRTTDVAAARAFYAEVLGAGFEEAGVSFTALPERLTAMGVPPHWVGHLGVDDVEATLARIGGAGGQPVGPLQRRGDGGVHGFFRDPLGVVVAVSSAAAAGGDPVSWRMLHARDPGPAFDWYAALFGWAAADRSGFAAGHRPFAWEPGGAAVGSVTDLASRPGIHVQWQFCFPVADARAAAERVRAGGGLALPGERSSGGDLFIVCEDRLRGAFALHQRAAAG
jgi:uncharacterized protein